MINVLKKSWNNKYIEIKKINLKSWLIGVSKWILLLPLNGMLVYCEWNRIAQRILCRRGIQRRIAALESEARWMLYKYMNEKGFSFIWTDGFAIQGKFMTWLVNSALEFIWKIDIVLIASRFLRYRRMKFNEEFPSQVMNFPMIPLYQLTRIGILSAFSYNKPRNDKMSFPKTHNKETYWKPRMLSAIIPVFIFRNFH